MTALEKFNEINGLEKLREYYYESDLKVFEDAEYPKTMIIIQAKSCYNHEFLHSITFECDESIEEMRTPYITAFVGYNTDVYDTALSIYQLENTIDFLKEVNKILGLED